MRPDADLTLTFNPDGTVQSLYDNVEVMDEIMPEFGVPKVSRASHVRPLNPIKRMAFIILRKMVSDNSKVAAWTRKWKGPWVSNMKPKGGPVIGPYVTRKEAIDAEKVWLWENVGI